MLRRFTVALMLFALFCSPASGFDTYWHQEAVRQVAETFGFALGPVLLLLSPGH
jgi:hypothetical protein